MTGTTTPDAIPYPNDPSEPADLLTDLAALADGAQAAVNNARAEAAPSSHTHNYAAPTHTHNYSAPGHTHNYAAPTHTHSPAQSGVSAAVSGAINVPGGGFAGPLSIAHGLGRTPTAVVAGITNDTGVQSVVASVSSWDATNAVVVLRNLNPNTADEVRVTLIAVG